MAEGYARLEQILAGQAAANRRAVLWMRKLLRSPQHAQRLTAPVNRKLTLLRHDPGLNHTRAECMAARAS